MKKKTNSKKIAIIGGAALLTGIAAYVVIKKRKAKAYRDGLKKLQDNTKTSYNQSNLPVNSGFPLKIGSRGENVKKVQALLNQKYKAGLVVDGVFGSKTGEAIKKLTGSTSVTEAQFKQYIGTPIVASIGISTNAKSNTPTISLNPFTNAANGWNLAMKKLFS